MSGSIDINRCALARAPPSPPPRYAPGIPLPPYAYVSGHGLSHPVNDPGGHSYGHSLTPPPPQPDALVQLPTEPASRRRRAVTIKELQQRPGFREAPWRALKSKGLPCHQVDKGVFVFGRDFFEFTRKQGESG